jgi:hypothetical protein
VSEAHRAGVPGNICNVPRFVIPAKAGIQPGFRLALRLAGMTRAPADRHPAPAFGHRFVHPFREGESARMSRTLPVSLSLRLRVSAVFLNANSKFMNHTA